MVQLSPVLSEASADAKTDPIRPHRGNGPLLGRAGAPDGVLAVMESVQSGAMCPPGRAIPVRADDVKRPDFPQRPAVEITA